MGKLVTTVVVAGHLGYFAKWSTAAGTFAMGTMFAYNLEIQLVV